MLNRNDSQHDEMSLDDDIEPELELDAIDESYQSLSKFFVKWKEWKRQQKTEQSGGNDYNWWFSRLMEEKSTKLKKHLSNFEAVWQRYQFEIQAIN
jgi:hypothetical protein